MSLTLTWKGFLAITLGAALAAGGAARGENWPQFRGAGAAGVSSEKDLAVEWSATKNIAWKVEIPGIAWSSPVVWEDKVFLSTAVSEGEVESPQKGLYFGGNRPEPSSAKHRWEVHCLHRLDGKTLWRQVAVEGKPQSAIHLKNSYASETPVTDGERLYVSFGAAGLHAYDVNGKHLWKKELGAFPTRFGWGSASSLALDGGRLFVLCDNEEKSFLAAFDKQSGEELWRAERDEVSSWATPFIWRTPERTELVTAATKRVRSYDPASGKLIWELGGMSGIVCPTPVAAEGLLFVSSGYVLDKKKPIFAIRPGAAGDISPGEEAPAGEAPAPGGSIAWLQKLAGPYITSPLVYGERLYVLYDQGFFACFEAKSGKPVYAKQRIEVGSGAFTASPWAYGGKIFCLSEDGDTFVIQAGPEFKVIGKNSLNEMCMATPAIAGGSLLIRGIKHLYCVREVGTASREPARPGAPAAPR